jgi:hypothetical protein
MKFFKLVLGLLLSALTTALTAQTNTTTSGTWNDASVWSTGVVPGNGTVTVNVNHPLEINANIAIGTTGTGVYNIFQSMTDFPGGTNHTLEVGGTGTLDVQGGTTYFGGALASMTSNGASIRVRSGATLILTGPTSFANGTTVLIDAGGTLIINGDFSNNIAGAGSFTVEGTVYIDGNYNSNGNVDVVGSGDFFTTGAITTGGAAGEVFGSPNNCGGPCSGQNLCLGGSSNIVAANQYLCSGSSAAGLTGDAVAGATFVWQSSITSATSGFTDIPSTNVQNYNPGTPAQTTWYRRRATVGTCTGTSNAIVITIIPAAGWIGETSDDWNVASNWCGGALPTNATDVVIPAGVLFYPVVSSATVALCRNLMISSGASLTINSTRQLNVSGNLVNNGTITVSGTIAFNGSTAQTISGSGFGTFGTVVVNNSSGATPALTIPSIGMNITTGLTMTAGKINLSNANLTLGTAAASTGTLTYTDGWVYNGNLTRWINSGNLTINTLPASPSRFPIGSSSDYRPIYFGNPGGITTGGTIRASHTAVSGSTAVAFSDTDTTPIEVRTNSFWTVAIGGGLSSANVFSIRTDATGMGTVGDINDLRLTLVASAAAGTFGTNAGIVTNPQVNRTDIPIANLANNYYWGSIDDVNTPLPVELTSFTATLKFDVVELKWSTASELNNDYFTIERTIDLENFEEIVNRPGNGTTNGVHHYNAVDESPAYGRSYYRLKQTDFDGKYTYSDVRVIDYEGPKFSALRVYPNPLSGTNKLNVVVTGLKEQTEVPIMIYNVQGQLILEQVLHSDVPGTINHEIVLTERLRSGLYIIKAGPTLQLMQKLVVE